MPSATQPLLYCFLFNSAIALILWMIGFGDTLAVNFVFSQSIGFSICAFCQLAILRCAERRMRLAALSLAVVAGALVGQLVARLLTGRIDNLLHPLTFRSLLISLVAGAAVSLYYLLRERNLRLESELQARELQRTEAEKRSVEAHLKMLQAQIEPHFLFNTLANVASLIDTDPASAKHLLDALTIYLRSSLSRTRAQQGTLGDEVKLLTAYLEILKIRMGERLQYSFDIAPDLLGKAFPPMLLQPLVENAVIHGLEPMIGGGRIRISAEQRDACLRLTVSDDGAGMAAESASGVGLANVRARLQAVFGSAARLELSENVPRGINAVLETPA